MSGAAGGGVLVSEELVCAALSLAQVGNVIGP
jgi:hypothetical protein